MPCTIGHRRHLWSLWVPISLEKGRGVIRRFCHRCGLKERYKMERVKE